MLSVVAVLALFLLVPSSSDAQCPQTPTGYWSSGTYRNGLPAPKGFSYMNKPASLSCDELESAHMFCIKRINEYRSGARVFSNGLSDPNLGTPVPLKWASGMDKCHSEISLSDFSLMGTCGEGAHKNAWNCDGFNNAWAQNLCCPRTLSSINTYQGLIDALSNCLQSMWNEGQDPGVGVDGHWVNMKGSYQYASCGFAFGTSSTGSLSVLMTQNFGGAYGGQTTDLGSTLPPSSKSPTQSKSPTSQPTPMPTVDPTERPTIAPTERNTALTTAPTRRPVAPPTRRRRRRRGLEEEGQQTAA